MQRRQTRSQTKQQNQQLADNDAFKSHMQSLYSAFSAHPIHDSIGNIGNITVNNDLDGKMILDTGDIRISAVYQNDRMIYYIKYDEAHYIDSCDDVLRRIAQGFKLTPETDEQYELDVSIRKDANTWTDCMVKTSLNDFIKIYAFAQDGVPSTIITVGDRQWICAVRGLEYFVDSATKDFLESDVIVTLKNWS